MDKELFNKTYKEATRLFRGYSKKELIWHITNLFLEKNELITKFKKRQNEVQDLLGSPM